MKKSFEKKVDDLRNLRDTQGQKGTWDMDEYMRGLYNGLELALATFEEREPVYKEPLKGRVKTTNGAFIPPKITKLTISVIEGDITHSTYYEFFDGFWVEEEDAEVVLEAVQTTLARLGVTMIYETEGK